MALKNSAARCSRLTRPASPSRRTASTTTAAASAATGTKFKSKVLAALDEQFDFGAIYDYGDNAVGEKGNGKRVVDNVVERFATAKPAFVGPGTGSSRPFANSVQPSLVQGSNRQHATISYTKDSRRKPVLTPVSAAVSTAESALLLLPSFNLPANPATEPVLAPTKPLPKSRKKTSSSSATPTASNSAASTYKEPEEPLPIYSYKDYTPAPAVVYTRHEEEANDIVAGLKGPVGFDMEWRVLFQRGGPTTSRRTALIQVCDKSIILLVQISAMKRFPQKLKDLIENPSVPKVGANIRNDGTKLFTDFHIAARNLVELGALARQADPAFSTQYKRNVVSLARMVRMYERREVDKGSVRVGNWERVPLAEDQKTYAANDAHSALRVYLTLLKIAEEKESILSPEGFTSDIAVEHELSQPLVKTVSGSTTASTATSASSATAVSSTTTSTTKATEAATTASTSSTSAPTSTITPSLQAYIARLDAAIDVQGPLRCPPRPQHLRAYTLWHQRGMSLDDMRGALRSKANPLAASTVISYVVGALRADDTLPYSHENLKALARSEPSSWTRHREWIERQERKAVE